MPWTLTLDSSSFALSRATKTGLLILLGAAGATTYAAYRRRKATAASGLPPSAVVSTSGIRATIDQLLQAAYGAPDEVVPFTHLPSLRDALNTNTQLAVLCERHCSALQDFTGEYSPPMALDLGCGVGGCTFQLAAAFPYVIGVDASKECIAAAKVLKERGWMRHVVCEEGELTSEHVAVIDEGTERQKVKFMHADPTALPPTMGAFDAVLVNNVLTQVGEPAKVLAQLPHLVRPGGCLVVASTHQWRESVTNKSKWLGGYRNKEKEDVWTSTVIQAALSQDFELIDTKDVPALQRQHRRGYTLSILETTVWRRKG